MFARSLLSKIARLILGTYQQERKDRLTEDEPYSDGTRMLRRHIVKSWFFSAH